MKLKTQNGHFLFVVSGKERFLGYKGESQTQEIVIQLDDTYDGWTFRMEFGDASNFCYLTQEGTSLNVTMQREWMGRSGAMPVQISGSCGEIERRSNIVWFQVAPSVGALDRPDDYPVAFRQLEQRLCKLRDTAMSVLEDKEQVLALKEECDALLEEIGGITNNKTLAQDAAQSAQESAVRAENAAKKAESAGGVTICDTLTSQASGQALSARQGSVLKRYAVDLRFRDRMIPEPLFRYSYSTYTNLVAHCATASIIYLLLENASGTQVITALNRSTGRLQKRSSTLDSSYTCMGYDAAVGSLLLGNASGVTVMMTDLSTTVQRSLGSVSAITTTGEEWILYSGNDLVWIQDETTESKRMTLPDGIRTPKSIAYCDGIFYLMTPVSASENPLAEGTASVTAMESDGTVLKTWIVPRGYGTLESVTAENKQLAFGYRTDRGALMCMGDYRDTVDLSTGLGAVCTTEEYSIAGYSETVVKIYANAAYTGPSNGTNTKPYSSIKDALDAAHRWKSCPKIQLYTTGNFTDEGEVWLADFPRKIEIINDGTGTTKVECLSIVGCPAVRLEGITLAGLNANQAMLDVDQSHVIVAGCTLNLLSGSGTRYGIRAMDSCIMMPSSNSFQNVTTGAYLIRSQIHVPTAQRFSGVTTHIALSEVSEGRFLDSSQFTLSKTNSFVYSVDS